MNDYLDRLEAQLVELTERGAHRRLRARIALPAGAGIGRAPRVGAQAVVAVLSVLVVVGVAAVLLSAHSASRTGAAAQSSGQINPVLVRNFVILRRPVQPGDQLPREFLNPAILPLLRAPGPHSEHGLPADQALGAKLGLLPALSHRVVIPGTHIDGWLEPGRSGYCFWVSAPSIARDQFPVGNPPPSHIGGRCALAATVSSGALLLPEGGIVTARTGQSLATGLVPDRVKIVELVSPNGTVGGLQLTEGFFATRFAAGDRLYGVLLGGHRQLIGPPFSGRTTAGVSPTSSGDTQKVVAQINLQPPGRSGTGMPTGVAQVIKQGTTDELTIAAQHVPANTRHNAYAIWLYKARARSRLLGFVNPGVDKNGRLATAGGLPANAGTYTNILITLETRAHPTTPGKIVLSGTLTLG